jgi:hypothetical protein
MAGVIDTVRRFLPGARPASSSPFAELGFGGAAVYGGAVWSGERNAALVGSRRWVTAQEIAVNMTIVAAGLRYFLNLTARPTWRVDPAEDQPDHKSSDAAKQAADFVETVLHGADTSWSRLIRRQATYRFYGYGLHEWVAKRREDGRIGIRSIEPRPQKTISGWDMDDHNSVQGVEQLNPKTGRKVYLPREKLVYFVDDALTDDPEGLGWYRHLVEPRDRMTQYLRLEKIGFERDLSGTPIGRAPLAAIKAAVKDGQLTKEEAGQLTRGIEEFVRNASKQPDTGLMLDSQTFTNIGPQGDKQASSVSQWAVDLLSSTAGSAAELGSAIQRTTWDMAAIMGVERLLIGREGAGSLALSEDTTQNLILNINSTTGDMAEAHDRDLIGPVWALNGFPPELRPTLKVEDASFKDAEKIARTLADMATAGAVLAPDDPAIDDVRDLAGISRQPEMTPERMLLMGGGARSEPGGGKVPSDNPNPDPTQTDPNSQGAS